MEKVKYHYLDKKIIEIKMKDEITLPRMEGVRVLKSKGVNLKLEVDTKVITIQEVLKWLDTDNLMDNTISNIPLEDIITQIYKEKS